jgi:nucleoside-diphosphate-sugar epimerase
MDVLIAGGHGNVARRLSRRLALGGDRVRALIRSPDHGDDVVTAGAEPVVCDLEHSDDDVLAAAVAGAMPWCSRPEPDPAAGRNASGRSIMGAPSS